MDLFQYDSLGRLTAEYLHEKSATLDDNGVYVGGSGQWSDVFTYDDRSNLISHMDARGVKTIYDYADDPLNRLQHVTYDLSGFGDKANPVMPSPPVTFRYMTTGDVTRVFQVVMQRENDNSWGLHEYGYDSEGRLASKALSYLGNPQLVSNYKYDNFDRLTQEIYPAEYGTAAATREQIDYIYGTGGVLSELMIDGVDYVSQVVYNPARQISRCGPKHTIMIRMATAPALRRQVKRRTAHPSRSTACPHLPMIPSPITSLPSRTSSPRKVLPMTRRAIRRASCVLMVPR